MNVQPERNINSDFPTLATIHKERLERRGERNVPKRYLKNAEWAKNGPLGAGYYIGDPDDDSEEPNIIAVDFNFQALQWGLTYAEEEHYILERPAPIKCGLRIFDKERTPDRSRWGPIDGTPDEEENPGITFKFGSDTGGDTPDPDIAIPLSRNAQEEESRLAVTFGLNVWLDLSREATTKSLRSLDVKLSLQVLCKSTRAMTIRIDRKSVV